jgi:signal transduction histidine kinase
MRYVIDYNIVKAHGEKLTVKTEEGIGSTFTIQLPVN